MRDISCAEISRQVARLCQESNFFLPEEVEEALRLAAQKEEGPAARQVYDDLLLNSEIAARERLPLCQDTGAAVVLVELGQEVHITGGLLYDAINEGVARGYREGWLRKSMLYNPWTRLNTGDNTPAVIHISLVPGDRLTVTVMPKGGGAE
ncbi:MAG: fumarate hydratase, partial [Clostridiales bacterium]|nr:fumarate hydratase [Clostridiales bacterium]